MALSDALPDRPLTYREISKLDDSERIERAVPVVEQGPPPRIVCLLLYIGEEKINLGWHPDREHWGVVSREPRQGSD